MTDTKIAPDVEKPRHSVDNFLLRFLIEIDHHVSAENEIEQSLEWIKIFEVQPMKSDDPFDMRSYLIVRFSISADDPLKMGLP